MTAPHWTSEDRPPPRAADEPELSVDVPGMYMACFLNILATPYAISMPVPVIAAVNGVAAGAGIAHQPIAADSTIVYLRLAITAGSTSLTGLTAGEMQIWLKICRSSGRNRILA